MALLKNGERPDLDEPLDKECQIPSGTHGYRCGSRCSNSTFVGSKWFQHVPTFFGSLWCKSGKVDTVIRIVRRLTILLINMQFLHIMSAWRFQFGINAKDKGRKKSTEVAGRPLALACHGWPSLPSLLVRNQALNSDPSTQMLEYNDNDTTWWYNDIGCDMHLCTVYVFKKQSFCLLMYRQHADRPFYFFLTLLG